MRSFITILKTELKLSLRGMDMFIFAICMPIVVLVAIGIIYGSKPAFEGANYTFLEQSFGAITSNSYIISTSCYICSIFFSVYNFIVFSS